MVPVVILYDQVQSKLAKPYESDKQQNILKLELMNKDNLDIVDLLASLTHLQQAKDEVYVIARNIYGISNL